VAGAGLNAAAQSYPVEPARIAVGFAVGGVTDLMAGVVAQALGEGFAQQFGADNRPAAGTAIADQIVATATADGSALLMMGASFAVHAGVAKKLPVNPGADFVPVILVASAPQVLVASLSLPVKSVRDLIKAARAKPGRLKVPPAAALRIARASG
jgi:tripartite-type tricarboxylate transporter receptor subunit TctC